MCCGRSSPWSACAASASSSRASSTASTIPMQGPRHALEVRPAAGRRPVDDAGGAGRSAATCSPRRANWPSGVRDFGLAVQRVLCTTAKRSGARSTSRNASRTRRATCTPSSCTLSRLDHLLTHGNGNAGEVTRRDGGPYFLRLADRRIRQNLAALWDNDDEQTTQAANAALDANPGKAHSSRNPRGGPHHEDSPFPSLLSSLSVHFQPGTRLAAESCLTPNGRCWSAC